MAEWSIPGYTGLRALGSGGFGEVMLARHDASGVLVAIKYLRHDLVADQGFAEMFRGEAAVLASLDDPNIVRLYEYVESTSGAAIVMELINGVSLREILAHEGSTTAEAALVVLQGSLLGLAAAHRHGVVHRDYKPENVLVNGEGASKLTDFGLAARTGEHPVPAGTLLYVAPEQIAGAPASPASDVYSATATFYECLAGRPPFTGEPAELLRQHRVEPVPLDPVPGPLRPLVAAGMAKDPKWRAANAGNFVTELETVAAGAYGQDWARRGRSHLGEAVLLLAALWPSGAPAAVQGATVHRTFLLRHISPVKAAIAVGVAATVVAAGVAVAAAVSHRPAARDHPIAVHPVSLQPSPSPSLTPSLTPSPSPSSAAVPAAKHCVITMSTDLQATQTQRQLDLSHALGGQPLTLKQASINQDGALSQLPTNAPGGGDLPGAAAGCLWLGSSITPSPPFNFPDNIRVDLSIVPFASPGLARTFFGSNRSQFPPAPGQPTNTVGDQSYYPNPGPQDGNAALTVLYGQYMFTLFTTATAAFDNEATRLALAKAVIAQLPQSAAPASPSPSAVAASWNASELTITSHSLGAVTIGMTIQQASAAAGEPLAPVGDGVYYPAGGTARGLSVLGGGAAGGTVDCISANTRGGNAPTVTTPQGFPLGGTLAQLKTVYGSRLRFVPAPTTGGISPLPGYIVAFPDGNLVFWVQKGRIGEIAGGPGMMPSIDCS